MAAQLSSVMGQDHRVAEYLEACRREGIPVLPPDVNASSWVFRPEGGGIRFGLGAVKNVGWDLVRALEEARQEGPFTSLADLLDRLEEAHPNRKALESLIKAGAMDAFGHRRWLLAELEVLMNARARGQPRARGQTSLFGPEEPGTGGLGSRPADVPPFDRQEELALEKEVLGFTLSGDPLAPWREWLARAGALPLREVGRHVGREVLVGGTVAGVKAITTRRGEPMAFLTVADGVDQLEAVLFPAVYQGCRDLLEEGQPLLVAGQARTRTTSGGEELQLEARWVAPLTPQGLCLEVEAGGGLDWTERLAALLRGRRGSVPVWLLVEGEQERALILLPWSLWLADGESGRMAERLAAMEGIPVRTAVDVGRGACTSMKNGLQEAAFQALARRGVQLEEMARLVQQVVQEQGMDLSLAECRNHLEKVLEKREVLYAILTGVTLDELAEAGALPEPLQEAVANDLPLYGVDEILATSITNIYGAVSLTRFGYLDKKKPGLVGLLNRKLKGGAIHTFMDDLVAGIVAATVARIEHAALKGAARLPGLEKSPPNGLATAAEG